MRQTAPQPVSSRREYEDDQPEAEQTAPRTARRLNIRITNFSRFDALVFNEDSREVAQVPGKRWSGVSEFGDGYWAALNVEGVWCEADIKRNGDNFQILSRTTCTKVEIE
jgi:hypothetical protein